VPTITVYLVYLWTVINVGRPQDIFPILQELYPGVVVAGLCFMFYLFTSTSDRHRIRGSLLLLKESKLLVAFALLAILSTPFSYYPRISLDFLKEFFLKFGLYLYLLMRLITTRERIIGLLWTLILSGLLMALAAFAHEGASIRVGGGATYDPNDLAMLMVTVLPLTIMPVFMPERLFVKLGCLVGAIFMLLAVMATQSRGGFLGLVAIAIALSLVRIRQVPRLKRIVPLLFLTFVFISFAGEQYIGRLATITDQKDDGSGRVLVWKRALFIALKHPILGVGPNAFETAYGNFLEHGKFPAELSREATRVTKWQTAHNSYLLVLVELGIPGFLAFLAINFSAFRNLRVAANLGLRDNHELRILQIWAFGLFASLVGFCVCSFFLSQCYNTLPYVIYLLSYQILRTESNSSLRG
jgi:O-antigen ligase